MKKGLSGGVLVFVPDGTHLGTIATGVSMSNCAWGGDGSVLYVTADKDLYRIRTKLAVHRSKSLGDVPVVEYAAAITMGCGDECPQIRADMREDWDIPDPRDMPLVEFRVVRDLIRSKVVDLPARL